MPLSAGPFLSIKSIDSQTSFPQIKMQLCIKGDGSLDLSGVTDEHLTVYEDGYRGNWLKVKHIAGTDDILYLVFSVDSSKSISREFLKSIKANAREIISGSGARDKIAIYHFDDDVKLLTGFTEKKQNLISHIERIERHGTRTMLFNSLYDSLELLNEVSSDRKKIIVFTDGKDEGSSIRDEDVISLARKEGVPIYFISLKSSQYKEKMARIAKLTGGKLVYSDRNEDVAGMYRTILSVIKSTYEIEYRTQNKQDNKTHRIEVRLSYGEMRDRDFQDVVFYRDKFCIGPVQKDALFIILSAVFLLVLAATVLYFISREKKLLAAKYESEYKIDNMRERFHRVIDEEEKTRKVEHPTILADDSEYSYASAWLIEKDGPDSGKKFPLYWDEITLGRSRENSIVIPDESVSHNHCKIKTIHNTYYLFDLVSDNGTYLNGKKLLRPRILNDWDEIKIGRTRFIFRGSKRSSG